MNTKEGNRIIEQFMFPYDIIDEYRIDQLTYHSNWNELMKVVIEIEERGGDDNEFDIFGNCVQLGDGEFVGNTKIEAVWNAVVWWCLEEIRLNV